MGAELAWVGELCRLLLDDGTSLEAVAEWIGGERDPGEADRVLIEHPARLGALNAVVAQEGGRPASVSAWFARGEGPTLDDAMDVLGPWREFPRLAAPYQGIFELAVAGPCEVVGSTYDPPEVVGERRLVEIAVLRSSEA